MVFKVLSTSRPAYLARKLKVNKHDALERCQGKIVASSQNLSTTRWGFVFRGTLLFNSLPLTIRKEENLKKFRDSVRTWEEENIPAKPWEDYWDERDKPRGLTCITPHLHPWPSAGRIIIMLVNIINHIWWNENLNLKLKHQPADQPQKTRPGQG